MRNVPDLSVVMTVYNGEDTVTDALESILLQEEVDAEFIVVNDGSTDGTSRILDAVAARDSRLRVVHQEPNKGTTLAAVSGCALAQGKYIARQDADDVSLPGRFKRQVVFLDAHPEVGLCVCGTRIVAPDGELIEEIIPKGSVEEQTKRLREELIGVPSHGCCMFRRDAYEQVGGYHWQFYYAQDADLWLRLGQVCSLGGLEESFYELRESVGSISAQNREFQHEFCQLAHKSYNVRREGGSEAGVLEQAERVRKAALIARANPQPQGSHARAYRLLAARFRAGGNRQIAKKYLRSALKASPFSIGVWREWVRIMLRF